MMNSQLSKYDNLKINSNTFCSRLMIGTGKYKSLLTAKSSIEISKASVVTVSIRRAQKFKNMGKSNLIDALNWSKLWLLPNTAGCETSEEAIRIAFLGREMARKLGQYQNSFVKLEVIPDANYLLPDPLGTLKAAEYLVSKNFVVLPYINSDPLLAKQLEEIGCSAVMPLGSPIGSGQGLQSKFNLQIIIENAKVPVIVDAGIGTASEASQAMEMGASAVLLNTAIAKSKIPENMAYAMRLAVMSGRTAYLAGRTEYQKKAKLSSSFYGMVQ